MNLHDEREDDDYNIVLSGAAAEAALFAGEECPLSTASAIITHRTGRTIAPEGIVVGGEPTPAASPSDMDAFKIAPSPATSSAVAPLPTPIAPAPADAAGESASTGTAAACVPATPSGGLPQHHEGGLAAAGGMRQRRGTTRASLASSTDGAGAAVCECSCGSPDCALCARSAGTNAPGRHLVSRRVRESMVARHALLTPAEVRC